jgi:probable phosphoglycerate mutase
VTTTFWLLRHAAHDWLGRGIPGRIAGVGINEEGRRQAEALVQRFAGVRIDAIYRSPQQRTQETAAPLARERGLAPAIEAAFDEVDMGDWEGRMFDELRAIGTPWENWVHRRASAQPPGGERFLDVPARAMAGLQALRLRHPDQHVLVVSHGDVLKSIVACCLGMPFDNLERFDIAPAGVSMLMMGEDWMKVHLVNAQGAIQA